MEIKFDFEVDERFNYVFDEELKYYYLDTVRDTIKVFLTPLENEIDLYNNGVFVVILSDKIEVLKDLNIIPRSNYNEEIPLDLWKRIKENLTYTNFLSSVVGFLKDLH